MVEVPSKMSSIKLINISSALILCFIVSAYSQTVHKKFEYKYSFKPPYLAQKDGSVPFWEYGGNAIASGESVRLAPSLRSQKGAIWTKQPINFDWWEVDIMFKVTGRGRIGADGLAFWYTSAKGEYTGEVFGSSDRWNGLGLIFDSFDNDNKHNNPYIMAVLNDGTKVFDHKSDGSAQLLSGCLRDFRNKPFPTRARVEYYLNTLTVHFHNGMTTNEADYELCFRAENVVLPRGGYFGLSAATGGLADDHDALHLLASSLHAQPQATGQQMSSAEQQQLSAEYAQYQQKLDLQKEEYRKDHPDELRDKDDMEDWFESDGQRELRQIFQGQGQIHDILRDLHKKVDEVIGKQMTSLSMLTHVYSGQQGQLAPQGQPGQAPPQMPTLPIGRHDWDALLANNQMIINTIAELKGFIIEVSRKTDLAAAGAGVGAAGGAGVNPQFLAELRDHVLQVKQNVAVVAQRLPPTPAAGAPQVATQLSCPEVSCVSMTSLLTVVAAQLMVMFLYGLYKEKKEAQAKKFF
ncbi:protein ERGIC-53 isoform X2 [Plutella xylostella]|uniref:protein ERGIC-53 isoform X1 n=1 Tax=Plutella xylostella TaxID=51655 RepID=UPI002032EA8B|nr:protein ERGIC-53 isoform X1 [Plutella xylostella]XP_048486578.1 protein ERGIC-53 isoform X2 [Plutella xylostella]